MMTRARNWNDVSTALCFQPLPQARSVQQIVLQKVPEETNLADILNSDFQTPKL